MDSDEASGGRPLFGPIFIGPIQNLSNKVLVGEKGDKYLREEQEIKVLGLEPACDTRQRVVNTAEVRFCVFVSWIPLTSRNASSCRKNVPVP